MPASPSPSAAPANPQKARTGLNRIWHAAGYSIEGLRAGWNEKAFRQEAIAAMIEGKVSDDFTADGKPNLVRLKAKAGFQVTREEADAIFDQLTQAAK